MRLNAWACDGKKKSLTIVAGPFTEYKPGVVVEISSNNGIRLDLASGGRHGDTGNVAGQSWLFRGQHVAQDLQSKLHVLREEGFVL